MKYHLYRFIYIVALLAIFASLARAEGGEACTGSVVSVQLPGSYWMEVERISRKAIPLYKQTPEWKKHKTFQALGWTALGVGTAMTYSGLMLHIAANNPDRQGNKTSRYEIMSYVGATMIVASIPLFILSVNYKKQARALQLGYSRGGMAIRLQF